MTVGIFSYKDSSDCSLFHRNCTLFVCNYQVIQLSLSHYYQKAIEIGSFALKFCLKLFETSVALS